MNDANLAAAVTTVKQAAWIMRQHDLPAILERLEFTMRVGHNVDRSQFEAKLPALEFDRQVIEAAIPLWRMWQRIDHARKIAAPGGDNGAAMR